MKFYRVGHVNNQQGLWYDRDGSFAGRIHTTFKDFKNSTLDMPFDESCVGYLSATESLESLFNWFSIEDIIQSVTHGYTIMEYEINECDVKHNEKFNHPLIKESYSPCKQWTLSEVLDLQRQT